MGIMDRYTPKRYCRVLVVGTEGGTTPAGRRGAKGREREREMRDESSSVGQRFIYVVVVLVVLVGVWRERE